MTDFEFAQLTQRLNGATLTNNQASQAKELIDVAVLRGAKQPAPLTEDDVRRILHDEIRNASSPGGNHSPWRK
jgi:hypothetical protein